MSNSDNNLKKRQKIEAETLATFQEEIPSMYFSHLGEKEYRDYIFNAEKVYKNHFKFPPKMFEGTDLIDFGAGTGKTRFIWLIGGRNAHLLK